MKQITIAILALLVGHSAISGQPAAAQNSSSSKAKAAKARPEAFDAELLKQQAFALLDKEIDRCKLYSSEQDRIIVTSRIADIIWDRDPERARQLLRDSYAMLRDVKADSRPSESVASLNMRTANLLQRLRSELFSVAHKHDSSLFKEFLEGIRENSKQAADLHNRPEVFGTTSPRKRALVSMALKTAGSDPDKAIDHAISSLGYGVPEEFGELFKTLVFSHRTSATRLFARATDVFVAEDTTNLYDALILSAYLRFLPQPEPDRQLVQRFLAGAHDRLNRVWTISQHSEPRDELVNGALLMTARQLYPFYRIYWPEKSSELEALIRQAAGSTADTNGEGLLPSDTTPQTVEEKLTRASEEKDDEIRDSLYLEAALMLARDGNFARGKEVAGRTNNAEKRTAVLNYILRLESDDMIRRGDFLGASRVIGGIDDPESRVEAVTMFAKTVRQKDADLTRTLLEDTRRLLEKNIGSVSHARAYLWLASAYAEFDPFVSFELMDSAVRVANKTSDFRSTEPETRLVYLSRKSGKAVLIGTAKGDFSSGFGLLGRNNFWQAIAIAEKFDSQLLRGLSTIAVAAPLVSAKQ